MERRILIIGTGFEWTSLPVVQELGKAGNMIYLLLTERSNVSCSSKYVFKNISKKRLNSESTVDFVDSICDDHNITHLICLDEEIRWQLINNHETFDNLNLAFPSKSSYNVAINKSKSTSFAKLHGIPIPETFFVDDVNEIDELDPEFDVPFVIRGVRGVSSKRTRYANNLKELRHYYKQIYNIEKDEEIVDRLPLIQEYVRGPTYLTQGMAQNGKVVSVIPHLKLREWPVSGGVTCRAKTIHEPRLVQYMKTMLEELNWHGEAGMEWKYDRPRDDFCFIEMNPRFEGSLDLAVKAGVNLPKLLVKIMDNKKIPIEVKYKVNTHYRWFFSLDFKFFLNQHYSLLTFIREALDPRIHGELGIDNIGLLSSFWKRPINEIIKKISN